MAVERQHHGDLRGREFRLQVRRLANALHHGIDASSQRGEGTDYVNSRPYVEGDPVGAVDWRASARMGSLFVREYRSTRGTPIQIVVDRTPSMHAGSGAMTKFEWAVVLAMRLAFAGLARMSPVGLVAVGAEALIEPARNSRSRVLRWPELLRRVRRDDATALVESLRFLETTARPRSLVLVLSDLADPEATAILKRLPRAHEVVAIQLRDPAERGGLGAGFVRAREAETGRTFVAAGAANWNAPTGDPQELLAAGVEHVLVDLDRPVVPHIAAFLRARRGARRPR